MLSIERARGVKKSIDKFPLVLITSNSDILLLDCSKIVDIRRLVESTRMNPSLYFNCGAFTVCTASKYPVDCFLYD